MHNLMSAVRKNPSIQASSVMSDSFQKEMQERLKLEKPGIVNKLSLSVKEESPHLFLLWTTLYIQHFENKYVQNC